MTTLQLADGRVSFELESACKSAGQHHGDDTLYDMGETCHYRDHDYQSSSEFCVRIDSGFHGPEVDVVFRRAVLDKLPMLLDSQHRPRHIRNKEIDLPCSVWALVSLLVLLEGNVTMDEWFGSDTGEQDAALPANTLLVADFMGCADMKQQIITWLSTTEQDETASCTSTDSETDLCFSSHVNPSSLPKVVRSGRADLTQLCFHASIQRRRTVAALKDLHFSKRPQSSAIYQ